MSITGWAENIFEVMTEDFPNVVRDINLQIQEVQTAQPG